jgi:uroporphyrinogen III methyltransferase/synthase
MMQTTLEALAGKRILITRPAGEAKALSIKLNALGATTIEVPTIEITNPINSTPLDESIRNLTKYDWVIFTSVQGVRFFVNRMAKLKISTEILNGLKIAAIGSATAHALELADKRANFIPEAYLTERIASDLGDVRGRFILLPRANIASKKLPLMLRQRGAIVEEVIAYRTLIPPQLTSDLLIGILESGIDLVTFTSPSTVQNFVQILNEKKRAGSLLKNLKAACIGPVTGKTAKRLGINVPIIANTHTTEALVEAIVSEFGKK